MTKRWAGLPGRRRARFRLAAGLGVAALLITALPALAGTVLTYFGTLEGETNPWDDYVFFFEAGTAVTVAHDCIPNNESNPLDPAVEITGPGGYQARNDDSGFTECTQAHAALLSIIAPTAGLYTIRASSYEVLIANDPTDVNADGSYRLTIMIDGAYSIPEPSGPWNPGDGRLNQSDLDQAAPVAIYLHPLRVYAIDPATGGGSFLLEIGDEAIAAAGVPATGYVLLAQGVHPATGQPVAVYRLNTGEFQLNTLDGQGNPYVVIWDAGGALYHPPL